MEYCANTYIASEVDMEYVIKECNLLGSERKGYFLYIRARSEAIDRVEERLKEFGVAKILGEEKKAV